MIARTVLAIALALMSVMSFPVEPEHIEQLSERLQQIQPQPLAAMPQQSAAPASEPLLSVLDHIAHIFLFLGIGTGAAFAVILILRWNRVREWLSPMYLQTALARDLTRDLFKLYLNGKLELTQPRALFIGISTLAYCIFAGMVLTALLDLVATVSTTALSAL